jgi:molybdate transport system substrate-binding protein
MTPKRLTFAIPLIFALPACLPAQVTVLTSGDFSAAYQQLLPQFENSTGITVTTVRGASQGDGPPTIDAELRRGQPAERGHPVEGGTGRAISGGQNRSRFRRRSRQRPAGSWCARRHTPPDISTMNAFKQTLLQANSIGIQSTSGIYLKTTVFPQLGIAGPLADKLSNAASADVASGKVEMVVLPVSEIPPVRGVDFVRTIPADLQFVQVFAAAVVKGSKDPEAAKRLIDFLASEKATPAVEKTWMQCPGLGVLK